LIHSEAFVLARVMSRRAQAESLCHGQKRAGKSARATHHHRGAHRLKACATRNEPECTRHG
jgi:hypothetical protein